MRTSSAPGKIILSGEYAVVFGYPGIAIPSPLRTEVYYSPEQSGGLHIVSEGLKYTESEHNYVRAIVEQCETFTGPLHGTLRIESKIPIGRGMGSSTALVIAIARCLLGEDEEQAYVIEDIVNPGNSGLDFAVIWRGAPVKFKKGSTAEPTDISLEFMKNAVLIDTGKPNEITPELVAWMKSRSEEPEVVAALKTIGDCTERLLSGESPFTVFPDHHRAQVGLGVVQGDSQSLISEIELAGGVAKVLGAGGRTGGGGMILALHEDQEKIKALIPSPFRILDL